MRARTAALLFGVFAIGSVLGAWVVTWMVPAPSSSDGACTHVMSRRGSSFPLPLTPAPAPSPAPALVWAPKPLQFGLSAILQEKYNARTQCHYNDPQTVVFGSNPEASHHRFCTASLAPSVTSVQAASALGRALAVCRAEANDALVLWAPPDELASASGRNRLRLALRSLDGKLTGRECVLVLVTDAASLAFVASLEPRGTTIVQLASGPSSSVLLSADAQRAAASATVFRALAQIVRAGLNVFVCDTHCVFARSPFSALWRDADIEAVSDGVDSDLAYGRGPWIDDPAQGWGRYAMNAQIAYVCPFALYARATSSVLELFVRTAAELESSNLDLAAPLVFNRLLWHPYYAGSASGPTWSVQPQVRIAALESMYSSLILFAVHPHANGPRVPETTTLISFRTYHSADLSCTARMAATVAYLEGDKAALNEYPAEPLPKLR